MIRILCISHCLPHPATGGGNQRTALLLRALSYYGHTDLIQISRYGKLHPAQFAECNKHFNLIASVEPVPRGTYKPWKVVRRLRPRLVDRLANAFGDQGITYRPDPNVVTAVRQAMDENHYDVIVGRHLYPTAMAGLLANPPEVPVLIDLDDVDHVVARENTHHSVPLLKRIAFRLQRPQIERAVPPCLQGASHLWVSANTDANSLDRSKTSLLPNIPYSESDEAIEPCRPRNRSKEILVVASFGYAPNGEAMEHLLANIWPSILTAEPEATLRLVGTGINGETRAKWSAAPNVTVVGFVEDLREEYDRCAFCVVPVQRGGGTKIKAIECFAYGRTCVVTPHSHRGIEDVLHDGESLLRADTDESFSQACVTLLKDPSLRNALAEQGNQLVRENYSFERFREIIGQGLALYGLNQRPAVQVSVRRPARTPSLQLQI